jgi:hypothetical protein
MGSGNSETAIKFDMIALLHTECYESSKTD